MHIVNPRVLVKLIVYFAKINKAGRRILTMKQPDKWRETIDPSTLHFYNFHLKEVLGYPHAGNDVFYVQGIGKDGQEVKAFLKVER